MLSQTITNIWKPNTVELHAAAARQTDVTADADAGPELSDDVLENVAGGRNPAWVEDFLAPRGRAEGLTT